MQSPAGLPVFPINKNQFAHSMSQGQHSPFGEPIQTSTRLSTHSLHYTMHNYFFKRVSRAVYFAKCLEILNKISGLICFLWPVIFCFFGGQK